MNAKLNILSCATLVSALGAVLCAVGAAMIGAMTAVSSVLLVAAVGFTMVAFKMYGLAVADRESDRRHIASSTLPSVLFVVGTGLVLIIVIAI